MTGKQQNCLYCGASLAGLVQAHKRKYCSQSCKNKFKLRIRKPDVQAKLWQHEPAVFEQAMEMYWSGISSAVIARQFDMPVGTMYSWVHDFGGQRERAKPMRFIETPIHNWSLKEYFRLAESAVEWIQILRSNALDSDDPYENATVNLVCKTLQGQSAGKFAGIIYENLKDDPRSGKTYAFCNKCRNVITTISWNEPIYQLSKYIKTHGTFIWPDEKLGVTIEITKPEFERLIFLNKTQRKCRSSLI